MPTITNTHDAARDARPRPSFWLATFEGHPKRGGVETSLARADVSAVRWICLDMITITNAERFESERVRHPSMVTHMAVFSGPSGGHPLLIVNLNEHVPIGQPDTRVSFAPHTILNQIDPP